MITYHLKYLVIYILLNHLLVNRELPDTAFRSYFSDYFALLNNIGDSSYSYDDRMAFKEMISEIYFTDGESFLWNNLNLDGSKYFVSDQYTQNIISNCIDGIEFNYSLEEIFPISTSHNEDEVSVLLRVDTRTKEIVSNSYSLVYVLKIISASKYKLNAKILSSDLYMEDETIKPNTISIIDTSTVHISIAIPDPIILPDDVVSIFAGEEVIPNGDFILGCDSFDNDCEKDEQNQQTIIVDSFIMDKYEVTQELYKSIMGKNPNGNNECLNCPVTNISWYDVKEFIKALNMKTKQNYRLPTEAEWEYAATSNKQYKFSGASEVTAVAICNINSDRRFHPVGLKEPNAFGLFDMSGNVSEWVSDTYSKDYSGHGNESIKVVKGGSYIDSAKRCRINNRKGKPSNRTFADIGFRLVRSLN